jgi:hypothetical protein
LSRVEQAENITVTICSVIVKALKNAYLPKVTGHLSLKSSITESGKRIPASEIPEAVMSKG